MSDGAEVALSLKTATSLFIIAGGAFSVPLLCRPFKIPAAIGEIFFGVMVGPHILQWVEPSSFVHLTAELGFFILMFIAGLELDFRRLEAGGVKPLLQGLAISVCIFTLAILACLALGFPPFMGLVAGAISIGVPLVLLQETGLAKLPFGQNVMLVGSIGEFASIFLITIITAHSNSGGFTSQFFQGIGELAGAFLIAYMILVVLRSFVWWKSESFSRVVETHDPSEIGVRAGLMLMFGFVAVAASLEIDPILGAFMAGALFSFVFRAKGPLELKFMSMGNGFFIPFFFISVGLDFNVEAAKGSDLVMLVKLLAVLTLVRIAAFLIVPSEGKTFLSSLGSGLVLSAPLTLLVVVSNLGVSLQLIDATFSATIILLAVISSTINPFLFKFLVPRLKASEAER